MIRPSRRCALGMAVALVPALLPALFGAAAVWPWAAAVAAWLGATLVDALRTPRPGDLDVAVGAPSSMGIGATAGLDVTITAGGTRALTHPCAFELRCHVDERLEPPDPAHGELPPGGRVRHVFPLRPRRRGPARVHALWLRWRGPWGLAERLWRLDLDREIGVLPDIAAVRSFALRFFGSPRVAAGLKTERFPGDGSEFDALRKYEQGMDSRTIDWRASARHTRLMCRRFRAERNHQVIVAIDRGHRMSQPLAGIPRLDHAVNTGLLLSYLCLRTGDRVGLFEFGGRPGSFLAPQGGLAAFARLQRASTAIEYGHEETNYTLAMLDLLGRLRRRSLVVVYTHFVDSITARLMLDNIGRLARRHVVLFVDLADPDLHELERAEPASLADVGRAVVAADLRRDRAEVHDRLRRAGVHVLDARPGHLPVDLVNRYLDIKRKELV